MIQEQDQQESIFKADKRKAKGGLNVAYHPALMMDTAKALAEAKRAAKSQQKGAKVVPKSTLPVQVKASIPAENPYLNPADRIRTQDTPRPRSNKALKFVSPGKYVEQANQIRANQQLDKLKAEIAAKVKEAGMEKEIDLVDDQGLRSEPPPKVEWWDAKLVNSNYETFNIEAYNPIVEELVTHLVQHPVPIKPPTETGPPPPKALILTKKVMSLT